MSILNSWYELNFIASILVEYFWFSLVFLVFSYLIVVANYINKLICCIGFIIIVLVVNIIIVI